jgi:hypothetical protein
VLEGFVVMELARQATWSQTRVELFHYRTKDDIEIDAVLESRQGEVIEVVEQHQWCMGAGSGFTATGREADATR